MKKKILIVELWGLGDLTFATPFIREATRDYEVHLLAKPYARELLHPSHPRLQFTYFDAPWTRFSSKYQVWKWDWPDLFRVLRKLRAERFDVAISIRQDPRDHLLMWWIGARHRYGYPVYGSGIFLNHPQPRPARQQHRVENWRDMGRLLGLAGIGNAVPTLRHPGYRSYRVDRALAGVQKPIVCVHTGARIPVRRWPAAYFAIILRKLREQFDFHLLLIPDPDGYGSDLAPLADMVLKNLTVRELVWVLGRSELLLCNDSGPAHIAAECGRPVIAVFGPTEPAWFRPWGDHNLVLIRDLCPWRPCFDYCRFAEPHCLTRLLPETVWPQILEHCERLIAAGILPGTLRPHPLVAQQS